MKRQKKYISFTQQRKNEYVEKIKHQVIETNNICKELNIQHNYELDESNVLLNKLGNSFM